MRRVRFFRPLGLPVGARLLALAGTLALALALPGAVRTAGAATPLQAEQDALQSYEEARLALASGRLDEAELLLERVLMLMPGHAEARLDFALLLARRGQTDAARALILGLAQDPRTPADHATQLRALAARLPNGEAPQASTATATATTAAAPRQAARPLAPASAPAAALWRVEAALSASSNPLSRTGAEGVVLTLPDGPVTLPLSTRPQAGTVAGAGLLRLQGPTGLDVSVQRMDRSGTATAYRAAAWGALPSLAPQAGLPPLQWQLQTLRGFDNLRRHSAALAAPWPGGAQRLVLGAYAEPTQQDHGWLLRTEHRGSTPQEGAVAPGGLFGLAGLQWQASAERSASTARAQGYWRLNLALEAPLGPGRRLQAQATAQEDTHPYSPLLENNSRRRLLTTYIGVEQQLPLAALGPLGAGHQLVFRAFSTQRASNLSLFTFRDSGLQIALMRQW